AEFAQVLKQVEREGNTLSPTIRQAWETGNLRTLIKHSPDKATEAHISIIGHITLAELQRYLSTTEAANGFGNRHLWVCATRSKILPEGGNLTEKELHPLKEQLFRVQQHALGLGRLERDQHARTLWYEVYEKLSEGKPGLAGSLLARSEAHVMRLACIY